MPRPTAHQDLIIKRRQVVASARLRGLSVRQIREVLDNQGIINPKTGKAFNVSAIHSDIVALKEEWKACAAQDIADHKARILAELLEVKRASWQKKNFTAIIQCIERECKILGIDAPQVVKILEEHEGFKKLIFEALEHVPDEAKQVFIAYLSESIAK